MVSLTGYAKSVEGYLEWEASVDPAKVEQQLSAINPLLEKTLAAIKMKEPFEEPLVTINFHSLVLRKFKCKFSFFRLMQPPEPRNIF